MAQGASSSKERYWSEIIRAWQRSQLSVRDFCRRRRLSEPSFYAWRRVLRERGPVDNGSATEMLATAPRPAFVRVAVDSGADHTAIELVLAQGRMLRVRAGFDPDLLRQLVRVLEEPSC